MLRNNENDVFCFEKTTRDVGRAWPLFRLVRKKLKVAIFVNSASDYVIDGFGFRKHLHPVSRHTPPFRINAILLISQEQKRKNEEDLQERNWNKREKNSISIAEVSNSQPRFTSETLPGCVTESTTSCSGDRRRGWNERLAQAERGRRRHERVAQRPATPLPADSHLDQRREELDHHLPSAHRHAPLVHQKVKKKLSPSTGDGSDGRAL